MVNFEVSSIKMPKCCLNIRILQLKYGSHLLSEIITDCLQPNIRTVDVAWTHRWLAAKCSVTQGLKDHVTGINMFAAFGTINRNKLLYILSDIVNEDELRIIWFLLSNTVINMNIYGAIREHSITANTGTSEGDTIYCLSRKCPTRCSSPNWTWVSSSMSSIRWWCWLHKHERLQRCWWYLDKTPASSTKRRHWLDWIHRDWYDESWWSPEKVGSLLVDDRDGARRKIPSLSTLLFLNWMPCCG